MRRRSWSRVRRSGLWDHAGMRRTHEERQRRRWFARLWAHAFCVGLLFAAAGMQRSLSLAFLGGGLVLLVPVVFWDPLHRLTFGAPRELSAREGLSLGVACACGTVVGMLSPWVDFPFMPF